MDPTLNQPDISGLSPEELDKLLSTIGDPAKLQDIKDQMTAAQKLRDYRPEAGNMAGRVYVPNIGAALEPIINGYAAKRMDAKSTADRDLIYKGQKDANGVFLKALSGRLRKKPEMQDYNPYGVTSA